MKQLFNIKYLPAAVAVCGGVALLLRLELYLSAVDEKGLLIPGHPLWVLLVGLTAAVMVGIVICLWPLYGSLRYGDNFSASRWAALGSAIGGIAMMLAVALSQPQPGKLYLAWKALGLLGGLCLMGAGYLRLQGRRPNFLLYGTVCVFWLLHLVSHYRAWSVEPQLPDYLFSLLASVALLMFSYYQTAFSVGSGKRRNMLAVGLAGAYFGIAAMYGSDTPLLYGGSALWALTNLCSLVPVRRRPNPVTEGE